jgi:hypothetical protein
LAKLENYLRVTHRKAIFVQQSPAQDEGVIVKPEVSGIQKENFPDLRSHPLEFLGRISDLGLVSRLPHELGKFMEALD